MNTAINRVWAGDVPTVYRIVDFDRPCFVDDVANSIPSDGSCHIMSLSFEADGVRVNGCLTVQVADESRRRLIEGKLRVVRGLVSVTTNLSDSWTN